MNAVKKYEWRLCRKLQCAQSVKIRILSNFSPLLDTFAEEHAIVSMQTIVEAFGSPEEMAAELMKDVSCEERLSYQAQRKRLQVCGIILTAFFMLFVLHTLFGMERELVELPTSYYDQYGNIMTTSGK